MVYLASSGPYVLSGRMASGLKPLSVNVSAGSSIVLSNLTLTGSSNFSDEWSALRLADGIAVDIFISGTNSLHGSRNNPAIGVPEHSTATFRGDGYLEVAGGY